jgi:beta-lactamase superfamily II metal-dependent hydrolase
VGYEIDFIAVGDASRSGDAIALRYGNLHGARYEQTVVVIDGGTQESGQKLVQHVRTYYRTNVVDYAISTHPDCDHVSGLKVVVGEMDVGSLLMHKPWDRASNIRKVLDDRRFTTAGIESRLESALETASELEDLATQRKIPITEPFAGLHTQDESLLFLGPSEDYYSALVCQFLNAPAAKPPYGGLFAAAARAIAPPRSPYGNLIAAARSAATTPTPYGSLASLRIRPPNQPSAPTSLLSLLAPAKSSPGTYETVEIETLTDDSVTSPANSSSTILLLRVDGHSILLTGDAGVEALMHAADYAQRRGISTTGLQFWQVPHHGSERNLSPSVLRRIGGAVAFISAARCGAPKHPAKRVTNALQRRGTRVYSTCGTNIWHSLDAPARIGYGPIDPIPFHNYVGE